MQWICRGALGLAFVAMTATASLADDALPPDMTGQWVLEVGGHHFMVLTLTPGRGRSGTIGGDLAFPAHFTVDDNGIYSEIKTPIIDHRITHATVEHGRLHFTASSAGKPGDADDFEFALNSTGGGELRPAGAPRFWSLHKAHGPATPTDDWDATRTYATDVDDVTPSNPEMKAIFDRDQGDRHVDKIDWKVVGPRDAQRRQRTAELLAAGALHTGDDYQEAAFVFQHGDKPDDFLLAHTLAVVAVAKGRRDAVWIAAATLDRYLQNTGRPQIFGTQYKTPYGGQTTQEPYDTALVSDALRKAVNVPTLSEQRKAMEDSASH